MLVLVPEKMAKSLSATSEIEKALAEPADINPSVAAIAEIRARFFMFAPIWEVFD